MEKWNYLTYNRICHDSFPNHHVKSEVFVDRSVAISVAISKAISIAISIAISKAISVEAHESNAEVVVEVVD
jgi:hypothetical protein